MERGNPGDKRQGERRREKQKAGRPKLDTGPQDVIGMHKDYLRAQARRLLLLQAKALDAAANTIIITDREGTMLWANRAAQDNYGYSFEEIVGKNPRLFSSRRHDAAFYKDLWDTVLDGRVWNGAIFNLTKAGTVIQEEMTITPVIDDLGQVSHFIAIKQNITERKRMEEELHLRQFAIDRINDAVLISRPNGRLLYVNDAACTLLRYEAQELIGRAVYEIDPAYSAETWPAHWTTLRQAGSFTLETHHRAADGAMIPVEVTVNHLAFEENEYYCALIRDISERKRTENALRLIVEGTAAKTGGAFFRSCVRHLAQVLEVRCALVTEALGDERNETRPLAELEAYSVIGTPCEEIMLRGAPRLYHDGLRERFPSDKNLAILGTRSYHGLPLIDQNGKVVGHLAVLDDDPLVDDRGREAILKIFAARAAAELLRKRTEVRLLEAKEKAVTASEAKSQFLANMSHELRTPLNGVLGYAQILERDGSLNDRQLEAIGVIKSSGEHLLGLINDVLDLSKVEAAKIELEPAAFRLDAFLATLDKALGSRAEEKGVAFRQEIDGDTKTPILADEKRLRQVLFNLIGNAIKFTDRGEITLTVQRRGAYTRFQVEDTGSGIPQNELERIFEPFHQAGSRERRVKGTGLGLAISRTLVRLMGSDISVESAPERGSRFFFALNLPPAQREPTPGRRRAPRVIGYEGRKKRILVVDDRGQNRDVLREMLEPLGIAVDEAADGREALVVAARVKPDLVLMDLRMPGMDGLQTTRIIRRANWGNAIPVIAISASAYDLDRQACLAAGCDEFLAKPFRERELLTLIGRLMEISWTYDAEPDEPPCADGQDVPPPVEELEALADLCRAGDILAVRQRIEALREASPQHEAFTAAALELAAHFRMKAIRELVKEHLARAQSEMSDTPPTAPGAVQESNR